MIPQHHLPADIERTSMQIIAKELEERHIRIPRENLAVVSVLFTPRRISSTPKRCILPKMPCKKP